MARDTYYKVHVAPKSTLKSLRANPPVFIPKMEMPRSTSRRSKISSQRQSFNKEKVSDDEREVYI